jgi:trans-AT polyketide synthase/acyltransferase/oxidoreductase domain-containing protein
MGADLFKEFPQHTAAVGVILNYSIEELCGPDPRQELNRTEFTQPALFIVNALSYLKKIQMTSSPPDFVAGHSLGEYNALFAAGVYDFETGVRLVRQRGALMSRASGGGMAAVLGMPSAQVKKVLHDNGLDDIEIANLNAPQQVVISGPADRVQAAKIAFEQAGARRFIPLTVSGAFHSRYMAAARTEFEKFLSGFQFAPPKIPVISNLHARPYQPNEIIRNLADQITSPVRWVETIEFLLRQPNPEFEEIGPGAVLTGLIRQIKAGQLAAAGPS